MYPVPLNQLTVVAQQDKLPLAEECLLGEMADTLVECHYSNPSSKSLKSTECQAHQVLEFKVHPWHRTSQSEMRI
jgi:hypothetical protein